MDGDDLPCDWIELVNQFSNKNYTNSRFYIARYLKETIINAIYCEISTDTLVKDITDTFGRVLCEGKDPNVEFVKLKTFVGVSGPCGKILQYGEPTFSCVECALDATCVMCMDCYNASIHHTENHNLMVHTSQGCGMCDCGDEEAWKNGATCSTHSHTADDADDQELPGNIKMIASRLFKEILSISILSFHEDDDHFEVPDELKLNPDSDILDISNRYVTVIYNDEVHNFEEVIEQFKQLVRCSHSEASKYATSIDREGRMLIKKSNQAECVALREKFLKYKAPSHMSSMLSRDHKEPLVTKTSTEYMFTLQNLLIEVLNWLTDVCKENAAFRRILCNVSFEEEGDSMSVVKHIMLNDVNCWKKLKASLHNLVMSTYIIDPVYKKEMGILFIQSYKDIIAAFLDDDKYHDVSYSIISLTVQLFTVPSIAVVLMSEYSAALITFKQYLDFYNQYLNLVGSTWKIDNLSRNYSSSPISKKRHRIQHVLNDVRYILTNIPSKITSDIEDAFIEFFEVYVEFISYMQEMNPHVRESGNHILREKEWEAYFSMEVHEIRQLMPIAAMWCTSSPRLFEKSLKLLYSAQFDSIQNDEVVTSSVLSYPSLHGMVKYLGGGTTTALWEKEHRQLSFTGKRLFGNEISYPTHDMFKDKISFHIPLTRLFGQVMSYGSKFSAPYQQFLQSHFSAEKLLDIPLRSIVLCQQIESNMWKRNGTSMDNQSSCYRDVYKAILWNKDILMVQILMSIIDPDTALLRLIRKYKIEPYLVLMDTETCDYDPLLRMAESFCFLVLFTLTERYRINISEASEREILRKDIIHGLAIHDVPRSKIMKSIEQSFDNLDDEMMKTEEIDSLLNELAVKIPVDDGIKITLRLNAQFYHEFTPFYYHYSPGQRQKAEQTYNQRYHSLNKEFSPPPFPILKKEFANLRRYFVSPILQRFIYVVLVRYSKDNVVLCSDLLLHQILYLIMFGIVDEKTNPVVLTPKFTDLLYQIKNAEYQIEENDSKSIIQLVKALSNNKSKTVKDVKSMIKWIVETSEFLKNGKRSCDQIEDTSSVHHGNDIKVDSHKEKLRKRRALLMKNFQCEQSKFMLENADIFDKMDDDVLMVEDEVMETEESVKNGNYIVCGPNKGPIPKPDNFNLSCILCKDSEKIVSEHSTMMYGCLVEKSVVLKLEKNNNISDAYKMKYLLSSGDLHIQSCGHPMHMKCLQSIMSMSSTIEHILAGSPPQRLSSRFYKREFSCPLCKMAANCALPVVGFHKSVDPDVSIEQFLNDVDLKLHDDNDILEMEAELSESPNEYIDTSESISLSANAADFINLLRDTMEHQVTTATPEEEMDPATRFRDDMRRFYRRTNDILEASGFTWHCTAPYTLKMVAYTFSMLEFILRDKPLLGGIASYQDDFLHSFLRSLFKSLTLNDHMYMQELSREMLYLFSGLISDSINIPSILNMDIFTIFVGARFAIYSEDKCYDAALVELCLTAEVIKILLAIEQDNSSIDASAGGGDAIQLATTWGFLRKLSGLCDTDDPYHCPTFLLSKVKEQLLPLLRKLTIFLHYSTSIPGPQTLREMQSPEGEFLLLMNYLNIESITQLLKFENTQQLELITKWCTTISKPHFKSIIELKCNSRDGRLIELPNNFVELLMEASKYNCPVIKFGKIQTTALCLICGQFVCFNSYCCYGNIGDYNAGPSNIHAHECSGDLGVFLLFERCQVLFLPIKTNGKTIDGPYLDKYGEHYTKSRNKALTLSPQLYRKIELMWVKHEIRPMVARNGDGHSRYLRSVEGLRY